MRKAALSHWLLAFGLSFAGPTGLHYRSTLPLQTAEKNRGVYVARVRPRAKGQMLTAAFPIFCLQVPRAQDFAGENFRRPNGIKILRGTPGGGVSISQLSGFRRFFLMPETRYLTAKEQIPRPNEGLVMTKE